MSILNVVVTPDRIRVAVDTIGANPQDGRQCEFSKMVPLVHLNAVVAMRGHSLFLSNVFQGCHGVLGDFDALVLDMIDRLNGCYARHPAADLTLGPDGEFMGEQVVIAGWSPARERMVAMDYRLGALDGGFTLRKEIETWMLAPGGEGFTTPSAPHLTAAEIFEIASQQAQHALTAWPNGGFGGRLITCDLTRNAMTFSSRALLT